MRIGVPKEIKVHEYRVGPIARPREVHVVSSLPKTRSGKVIRRAIIAMAEGRDVGDLSTLEDEAAIDNIKQAIDAESAS